MVKAISGIHYDGEKHGITPDGKWYNFLGPATKLEKRLDPKNKDYPASAKPINKLDAVAKKHDIAYQKVSRSYGDKNKNELSKMVRKADEEFIDEVDALDNSNKLEKMVAKGAILAKMKAEDIGFLNKLKFTPREDYKPKNETSQLEAKEEPIKTDEEKIKEKEDEIKAVSQAPEKKFTPRQVFRPLPIEEKTEEM